MKNNAANRLKHIVWAYYLTFSLLILSSTLVSLSSCSQLEPGYSTIMSESASECVTSSDQSAVLEAGVSTQAQEQDALPLVTLPTTSKWTWQDYLSIALVVLTLVYTILVRYIPTTKSLDLLGWLIRMLAKLIPDRIIEKQPDGSKVIKNH